MTLPLLISVPHGGLEVPEEVAELCLLTPEEVEADGDVGAARIYDLGSEVQRFIHTDVARAVIDMNRAEDDFRKDGVIKTHTCWDVPIWKSPLGAARIRDLIAAYHTPYHARLSKPAPRVLLGVDCHTMAAKGPPVGPDSGQERPAACLSDADGTLPKEWFQRMVACFERAFDREIAVNRPFKGGYVIRNHAHERPWLQVELSRAPFDSLEGKRARVLEALKSWCAEAL